MRDYQKEISVKAQRLLTSYKIAYLNMQVRTGKTLTALQTAKLHGAKCVLFVTKLKAIDSVKADYYSGGYNEHFELYLINYESLHKFTNKDHDLVIIDEAHSIGAFPKPALRTTQLRQICKGRPIIYLSGTPSPESYSQLFHQFWASSFSPFPHPNFYKWAADGYVDVLTKYMYNREVKDYTHANHGKIHAATSHLFLSFTQEEAGFEQLVEERIHTVKMSDKVYHVANKLKRDKIAIGKNGDVIEADTEVKLLNKLHQLYSGTCIFDGEDKGDGIVLDMAKAEYILRHFGDKKLAIFYNFKAEANMLEVVFRSKGYHIAATPEEFNATGKNTIYISQFISGREGINLSAADCLVCLNINFSAVTYFQVRARLQTRDRTEPAVVHWLFAENGIEADIYKAVSAKKNYTLSYFKKSANFTPHAGVGMPAQNNPSP